METQTTLGSKRTELFMGLDHSPEVVHYFGLSDVLSKFIHPTLPRVATDAVLLGVVQ